MTNEQLYEKLNVWFEDGSLFTQKTLGKKTYYIYGLLIHKKIVETKKKHVYTKNMKVLEEFNKLYDEGQIMDIESGLARYPEFKTRYGLDRACAKGFAIKVRFEGASLYLKGNGEEF